MQTEAEQYQYPNIYRKAGCGVAIVKTYVGDVPHEKVARISPRSNEERDKGILDAMEKELRQHVERLPVTDSVAEVS